MSRKRDPTRRPTTLDPKKVARAFTVRAAERQAGLTHDRADSWLGTVDPAHGRAQREDDAAAAALASARLAAPEPNKPGKKRKKKTKTKKRQPLSPATHRPNGQGQRP